VIIGRHLGFDMIDEAFKKSMGGERVGTDVSRSVA